MLKNSNPCEEYSTTDGARVVRVSMRKTSDWGRKRRPFAMIVNVIECWILSNHANGPYSLFMYRDYCFRHECCCGIIAMQGAGWVDANGGRVHTVPPICTSPWLTIREDRQVPRMAPVLKTATPTFLPWWVYFLIDKFIKSNSSIDVFRSNNYWGKSNSLELFVFVAIISWFWKCLNSYIVALHWNTCVRFALVRLLIWPQI